ncbi:PEP-CTERM sorting domain-containing protein [Calycomorphotria hydatis]|nr:PEP-CTERM sorting domain-containing protein [Calycomorphotria hydatis]
MKALLAGLSALLVGQLAHAAILYDQPALAGGYGGVAIEGFAVGHDFTLGSDAQLTDFTVLLGDNQSSGSNSSGVLDDFTGTIGWGIYSSAGTTPGTLLFSGSDSSVALTGAPNTTALQDFFFADVDFSAGVNLIAGDYWLVIRDGAWGTTRTFGSPAVGWFGNQDFGQAGVFSGNEANPGGWTINGGNAAFTINGVEGAAVPEPTALFLAGCGALGLIAAARRRRKS